MAVRMGTPLAVERQELDIDCTAHPRCSFRAVYHLHNPTSGPVSAITAFWGEGSNINVSLPDRAGRVLTGPEMDSIVGSFVDGGWKFLERYPSLARPQHVGIDVALQAGERTTLVATGLLSLGWYGGRGYSRSPVHSRHALLQRRPTTNVSATYYLAPIKSFASVGPIALTVRYPSHWSPQVELEDANGTRVPLTLRHGRGVIEAEHANLLQLNFDTSESLHAGGPMLGIGGAFGGGLRLRAGYEIAAPSWLFYSVTAETDASDFVNVAPMLEVASDQVLIIPSFGMGAGVPVQVTPDRAVGARLQATMSFWHVGVVGSLDWYPGHEAARFALLGYVWF